MYVYVYIYIYIYKYIWAVNTERDTAEECDNE